MIAYVDTSVLLRLVLREPDAIEDLQSYEGLVSSELIAVESARTTDRLRLQGALTLEEAAVRSRAVGEWLEAFDLVLLRSPVLSRASDPMPMQLGTLDAIHLATALLWRKRMGPLVTIATHDSALGMPLERSGSTFAGSETQHLQPRELLGTRHQAQSRETFKLRGQRTRCPGRSTRSGADITPRG